MRVTRLDLNGFRAFAADTSLDLDADAVILVGPNGCGKTSVLDGLLWSLAGRVPRISGGDTALVSLFSSTGGARATAFLKGASENVEVRRSFDGERSNLTCMVGQEQSRGSAAFVRVCQMLWPNAIAAENEAEALTAALTRSVYLQQDRVRQFVEADSEQDRFTAVSELVGAGRIAEFHLQLDRERTAWSRATNERSTELESMRSRLAALEVRLASLASAASSSQQLETLWSAWWGELSELGVAERPGPMASTAQPGQLLDAAVRGLAAFRRDKAQLIEDARQLEPELTTLMTDRAVESPNLKDLRSTVTEAQATVDAARQALADAEAAASEDRRRQTELNNAQAELQAFAQLALRHMDETCPVCDQTYDQATTRERLARIAAGAGSPIAPVSSPELVPVAALALQQADATLSSSTRDLREAEAVGRSIEAREREIGSRLEALGLAVEIAQPTVEALRVLRSEAELVEAACERLHNEGESLAVEVARSAEAARKDEIQIEITSVGSRLSALAAEVARRESTGRMAVALLDGLREAGSEVVSSELATMEPLLQQLFSTIDPHPAFRAIRLLASFSNRRGRINAQLEDAITGQATQSPEVVLSSSQLNGLAVSIFLALNLGMRSLPLDALILDDPLQSLDDVNLLGLVDLLRRIRDHRQIIVSTHDAKFGELLARKLRPVSDSQRTVVHRFVAWGRNGPIIESSDVPRDLARLRIASPAA